MATILHALVLGIFALSSSSSINRLDADIRGRSFENSYNYNSYNPSSYSKVDSGSYGVGSSFVVSPSDHTDTLNHLESQSKDTSSYTVTPTKDTSNHVLPISKDTSAYILSSSDTSSSTNSHPYYNQGYYSYAAQDRFHPHKSKPDPHVRKPDEDSHTGEVVLPPATQDLLASGSSQEESIISPDSSAHGTGEVADSAPVQYHTYDYALPTSPPLPGGYDYIPPPPAPRPPPPPPTNPTPYYYYPPPPPSNHYLPVPPSNQYLPSPPHPPPPPTPSPSPPPPLPAPQEERQSDYTYYYIGAKLWYIPLFFSIYFVLYIGALIIKAVAKHKILLPGQLYNAATSVYQARGSSLEEVTVKVTKGLAQAALRYLNKRKPD